MKLIPTLRNLVLTAFLLCTAQAYAQLAGWQYRMPLNVSDTSGVTQTNYQVRLDINTTALISAGHMQSGGEDIRFADSCGTTVYEHYVESGINTSNTIIWVRVASIPANGTAQYFMYYGNSSALNTSSFANTFPGAYVSGGSNTTLTGALAYDWFQVDANDTVFVQAGSPLTINARNVIIDGVISGNGCGYQAPAINTAGTGPGGGGTSTNSGCGGGSYAGTGGTGGYDAGDTPGTGGAAYGTASGTDIDMGSSGGSGTGASNNGHGGGALQLNADYVWINGTITMNGVAPTSDGTGRGAGGGAGGAIVVTAGHIAFAGIFSADGGNGATGTSTANDSGGGGGGGRIKTFYSGTNSSTGTSTVNGGIGGPYGTAAPGQPGSVGTISSVNGGGYDVPVTVMGSEANLQVPTLTLSATAICAGDTVFASATSGFSSYTFNVNGVPVYSGTSDTYAFLNLNNGDSVSVSGITAPCFAANSISMAVTVNANSSAGTVSATANICQGSNDTLSVSGSVGVINWYEFDGSNYISAGTGDSLFLGPMNTAGTFTFVAVADNNGCAIDTSAMTTITVNAAPVAGTVSTTPADTNLCAFDSLWFTANGSTGSIEWLVQMGQVGPYTSFGNGNPYNPGPPSNSDIGAYNFVAVASAAGCPSDTSAPVALYVRETPVVTLGNDTTICGNMLMLDAGNPGYSYLWNSSATTQTIFATASGAYDVAVTTPYGCVGSDTINVTINQQPVVDLGADTIVCGSITLDAGNAGATYIWSNGPTTQTNTITSSGTYDVNVSTGPGCTDNDTIVVTINTPPSVALTASSSTVCVDDGNVTLTGTPAGGTYAGPGVTGNQFDPSVAGNGTQSVTYTFTDVNGCSDTGVVQITVNPCTGVADNDFSGSFLVYPNPNNGSFVIDFGTTRDAVIELVDVTGRTVQTVNVVASRTTINCESQPAGVYFVRVTADGKTSMQKISVVR